MKNLKNTLGLGALLLVLLFTACQKEELQPTTTVQPAVDERIKEAMEYAESFPINFEVTIPDDAIIDHDKTTSTVIVYQLDTENTVSDRSSCIPISNTDDLGSIIEGFQFNANKFCVTWRLCVDYGYGAPWLYVIRPTNSKCTTAPHPGGRDYE